MKKHSSKKKARKVTALDIKRTIIALATTLVIFFIMAIAVTPPRYDISVGKPAPNAIKASKDVADLITTNRLKNEAAAAVKSIYYMDDSAAETARHQTEDIFRELRSIAALIRETEVTDAQLSSANERLDGIELNMEQLHALGVSDDETLITLENNTVSLITAALDDKLGENQLEAALESIRAQLLETTGSEVMTDTAMLVVNACLKPNYFYDAEATEAARQAERDKVATVSRIKGEVIVSDGEIVTEAHYAMLNQLGMIKESDMDIYLYIGMAAIVIFLVVASSIYIWLFSPAIFRCPRKLLMIAIIFVLCTVVCILARTASVYLMPVTLGMLLITVLLDSRTALYINLILAIIASMMGSASGSLFNMATYSIFISANLGGIMAHIILRHRQTRTGIMLSGLVVGAMGMTSTMAMGLIASSNLTDTLYCALYSGASGVLAAIITVALTPLFESLFNAVTASRLIELANPNHPLLRRLLLEAPGTYHHSIIVANLAEAAANAIGANALLTRVGAYYHDVGKLKRPRYFKENQLGDNPHDRTDPRVSAAIIISHPKDGIALLRENRIPEEIQEIVLSHHGDTPVMWFYNKAKSDNENTNIDDFRYPGPRPHSREAALVMLADTVEAAARALKEPNAQSMRELIEKLIYQKVGDGQLNDCMLTYADIGSAVDAFVTVLSGAFHERIEYPQVEIPRRTETSGT